VGFISKNEDRHSNLQSVNRSEYQGGLLYLKGKKMTLIEYTGIHKKKTIQIVNGKIVFEASDKDKRKVATVDDETAKGLLRFKEFRVAKEAKQDSLFEVEPEIEPAIKQAIKKDRERINRKAKKR
jgi:hypothetical protein